MHINGSVVTVTLGGGQTGEGLGDIVRELFLHYGDTPTDAVVVPLDEADATPEALADPPTPRPRRPPPTTRRRRSTEEPAEQEIAGIPDAELAADGDARRRHRGG